MDIDILSIEISEPCYDAVYASVWLKTLREQDYEHAKVDYPDAADAIEAILMPCIENLPQSREIEVNRISKKTFAISLGPITITARRVRRL